MTDLVIVSMHERGFWQADIYLGDADTDPDEFRWCARAPDGFCTFERDGTQESAFAQAREHWPTAKIVFGEDDDHEERD